MTDEKTGAAPAPSTPATPAPATPAAPGSSTLAAADSGTVAIVAGAADASGAEVVAVVGDEKGVQAEAYLATDWQHTLILAAFADDAAAMSAYQSLRDIEASRSLKIDAVLVVHTDESGKLWVQKVTDHSTKTGLKWGVAGGIVLGVLFPPSIIASAAALGVGGGVLGKIRQEHHKHQIGQELAGSLPPNSSAILALVERTDVEQVKQAMPAATSVKTEPVDDATAAAITDAAKAADASAPAASEAPKPA